MNVMRAVAVSLGLILSGVAGVLGFGALLFGVSLAVVELWEFPQFQLIVAGLVAWVGGCLAFCGLLCWLMRDERDDALEHEDSDELEREGGAQGGYLDIT